MAHVIQVVVFATSPNAFLRAGRAHVFTLFAAQQDILKLHHASVIEEQGGIVFRDQGGAFDNAMVMLLKKSQECTANLITTGHVRLLYRATPPGV
jgi:hypothetical protein